MIVPEFGGLAHLPGDPAQLATTARPTSGIAHEERQ